MFKIFMTQGKKLLIYLIVTQKLDLKLFTNEIRQIIYSMYQSKEITKKVYNNLMKSL